MKKFKFPLDRALDWRRTQAQIAESQLQRLYAELRTAEHRLRETEQAREQAQRQLLAGGSATGSELAALDRYRKAAAEECVRLAKAVGEINRRVQAQLQTVLGKRRDVKLLEHLRADKLQQWNAELDREIDREASELHMAKLNQPK